jgi:acetamidase/formamidase
MDDHNTTFSQNETLQTESPSLPADPSRRRFIQETRISTAALGSIDAAALAHAQTHLKRSTISHYRVPATDQTVHWGYFSQNLPALVTVESGDVVTLETVTHHAYDDYERMIKGDPGVERIYYWDQTRKGVHRRGAGPLDASLFGRGAGEGLGVHICTGPVAIQGAEPGDILAVRLLDVQPRPCANPIYQGKSFGSNAAAWWGFHYHDLLEDPKPREVITIYEVDATGARDWVRALYNFRWVPQTDPFGVVHTMIDYPGVPVDHSKVQEHWGILKNVRIPIRPHFGVMGVAPTEADLVDSIPPSYTGGNIDNWRIGKGATMYYPVAVSGALFSAGDPHASQGDSELCGTAIECSLTGTFQLILHKQATLKGTPLESLTYPLLETQTEFLVHGFSFPNYLADLGANAQAEIYKRSSIDLAMRDAFRKMRHFLMTTQGLSEDETVSLMSVGVDFGVTQVVDGNWGMHAIVKKSLFTEGES